MRSTVTGRTREFRRTLTITALVAGLSTGTITAPDAPPAVAADAPPAVAADLVTEQWRATEIELTSNGQYSDPISDVHVDAVFTSSNGTTITRPAFWDGGSTWRVRFAPTETGTWTMTTISSEPRDAGLHGLTAVVESTPYSGDLEIYQRGFLRPSADGRHFEYADGTPFFYLGDTHWILPHERFDTSNAPGVASQFKYTVDKRVEQGFTVYQSEPIWQPHDEGLSSHDGEDEEKVANLTDGFDEMDLAGFANLDRKYAYVADEGLVHANAQVTWVRDPANYTETFTDEFMYEMGRYWVARYGAYPVIWTIGQEIDNDMYGQYSPETMSKWYSVGEAIAENDHYDQIVMPHMETNAETVASNSSWKDKPYHDAFGAQIQSWNMATAKDFWNSAPVKPTVLYEAQYEDFWTDARGALSSGYKAFQLGMYGYGYGVSGVWNDAYSAPGEAPDFGTDFEMPQRYQWWFDGANRDTADQLTIMRDFYTSREWWKYVPRFDDVEWASLPAGAYLSSDAEDHFIVLFADDDATSTGTLNRLDPAAIYDAAWFDPRTGNTVPIGDVRGSLRGVWEIPPKPTDEDWLLTLDRSGAAMPDGNLAANASASASSSRPGRPASKAVDGKLTSAWQACQGCWNGEWLQLQFDGEQTFNTVIAAEAGNRTRSYRIDYWKDGDWVVALEQQGSLGDKSLTTVRFPTVTSDRVRLYYLDGASGSPTIYEFGVFDAGPRTVGNLARDGTYSASSSWDQGQLPENAFDGDESTNWQACSGCWEDEWIEVDFGADVQFDSVSVSEYDSRTSAYQIQYWQGGEWKTAFQGDGSFGDRTTRSIVFAPVVGSKARILFLAGSSWAPIIYEFGVFNSGTSSLPLGDLAVGGLFSASSQWDEQQTASNAFDGRSETNWQACNGCWENEWLEVDFGIPTTFDAIMLSEYGERIGSYLVEYWADGEWRVAYEGTGPVGDRDLVQVDFPSVTGSKARIRFLSGSSFAPIIYDLGIYRLNDDLGGIRG